MFPLAWALHCIACMRVHGATIDARARAARLQRAWLPAVPYRRGRLAVSGEVLSFADSGDVFDVVEDSKQRTSAFLVDAGGHATAAALAASAVRAELRSRLADGRPLAECLDAVTRAMHAIANDVVTSVAIGIVRMSHEGTAVECLNAGLAPIVVASRGATALVEAGTATIPIEGDTAFLLASDGLDPAAIGDAAFRRLRALLEEHGTRLAGARVEELRRVIVETADLRGERIDDASLVIAAVMSAKEGT